MPGFSWYRPEKLKMHFAISAICCLVGLLTSCVSNHNDNEDGDNYFMGGTTTSIIEPGKFDIRAETNFAPWASYSAARKMWRKAATKLCKGKEFTEVNIHEYVDKHGSSIHGIPYKTTVKKGIAICMSDIAEHP